MEEEKVFYVTREEYFLFLETLRTLNDLLKENNEKLKEEIYSNLKLISKNEEVANSMFKIYLETVSEMIKIKMQNNK